MNEQITFFDVAAFVVLAGIVIARIFYLYKVDNSAQHGTGANTLPSGFGTMVLIIVVCFFAFNTAFVRSTHKWFVGLLPNIRPQLVDQSYEGRRPSEADVEWKKGTDKVTFRAVSGREWVVIEVQGGADQPTQFVGDDNEYKVSPATGAIKYYNVLLKPEKDDDYKPSAVLSLDRPS